MISVRVTQETHDALQKIAKAQRKRLSELTREICEMYVQWDASGEAARGA